MRLFMRFCIGLFVVGCVLMAVAYLYNNPNRRAPFDGQSPVGQIMRPSEPESAPTAQPPVTPESHPTERIPSEQPASR